MKKILSVVFLASAILLISGSVSAATNQAPIQNQTAPTAVKYTTAQQACIKAAQDKRQAVMKTATDTLNAATAVALKTRQDAMKTATDTLNAATKGALSAEQAAIAAAQKSTDTTTRNNAIRAALDAYNNSASVVKARVPYAAAIKAANDSYNGDTSVTQARTPYMAAIKKANDQFQANQKACLTASKGFFSIIGDFFANIGKFFSGKK